MTTRTPIPFALLCALTACAGDDGALLQTPDGRIRVVFSADAKWLQEEGKKEMESALARHADIDVVYAHNDPMARGAQLAAEQAGRTGIHFVGIDALPHEGVRYVEQGKLDATFLYPTCGAEAVDLGILLAHGIAVPKDIVLGTRTFTAANVAAGGDPVPAPGDETLRALRAKHAELLTDPRREGARLRIGMSQCNLAEPWRTQMNADIRARVDELGATVDLVERDAQNDSRTQHEQLLELITDGVDVILVSPKEEVALVQATRAALAAGIPVVVIDRRLGGDDYSCFVGGDNVMIGRAAGAHVRELLGPDGGTIVEIQGLGTSSPAQERHRGFVEALGLEPR